MVTATYTDGTTEDVTRWAQYQSNETEVAAVEQGGRVESRRLSGQAAIMARYQGQVAVFRATVPMSTTAAAKVEFPIAERDRRGACSSNGRHWASRPRRSAAMTSSSAGPRSTSPAPCPTPEEVKAFIADSRSGQAGQAGRQAAGTSRVRRVFRRSSGPTSCGTSARAGRTCSRRLTTSTTGSARAWPENVPYDQFVRAILAASGSSETAPPVQWYRKLRETSAFVDDTAQVFLGMRLQCAKCHHHPFEKWSQHDYYGFAAFFARVGRKPDMKAQRSGRDAEVVYTLRSGAVSHPKTGETMAPKGLGASVVHGRRRRRPAAEAGRLDGRPQEPVLRAGRS